MLIDKRQFENCTDEYSIREKLDEVISLYGIIADEETVDKAVYKILAARNAGAGE